MEDSCEILFELKYLEEISELFNELKEINNHLLINLLDRKNTQIIYTDSSLDLLDHKSIRENYGYNFDLKKVNKLSEIPAFEGSTVLVSQFDKIEINDLNLNIDFFINIYKTLGSILIVNGNKNEDYISEIQHVRRRETIAMTPIDCYTALQA